MTVADARMVKRFWSYVEKGPGCWLWMGARTGNAYGRFALSKHRSIQATWASVLIHTGSLPQRGDVVRHTCDNPPCVNPSHLVGNQAENLADMKAKGRSPDAFARAKRGADHPRARLTWAQVDEIRARSAGGVGQWPLAREFGVARTTIQFIVRSQTWVRP